MGKVPQTTTLNKLKSGQKATVQSISFKNKKLANKLLSMGIVAGTLVKVLRIAPFGDPIKIKALGYDLSMRLSEAESVEVLPIV